MRPTLLLLTPSISVGLIISGCETESGWQIETMACSEDGEMEGRRDGRNGDRVMEDGRGRGVEGARALSCETIREASTGDLINKTFTFHTSTHSHTL